MIHVGSTSVRRAISILLGSLVVALASPRGQGAEEITVAYANTHAGFVELFDLHESRSGVTVNRVHISTVDMRSALLARAEDRRLPDAVILSADNLGLDALAFSSVPLEFFDPGLNEQMRRRVKRDGNHLGIPLIAGNHLVLYYDKARFSEAPRTIEPLGSQRLDQSAFPISWNYDSMYWFMTFAGAHDAFPIREGEVLLDTVGMRTALREYVRLSRGGFVNPASDYMSAKQAFIGGLVPCLIDGEWAYGELKTRFGDRLGIGPLPTIGTSELVSYSTVQVLAFPNRSLHGQKRTLLAEFGLFLQSEEAQRHLLNQVGALPVHDAVVSELMDAGDENLKEIMRTYQAAVPLPLDDRMGVVWEAMHKGFDRYLGGHHDSETATAFMQHLSDRSTTRAVEENLP